MAIQPLRQRFLPINQDLVTKLALLFVKSEKSSNFVTSNWILDLKKLNDQTSYCYIT